VFSLLKFTDMGAPDMGEPADAAEGNSELEVTPKSLATVSHEDRRRDGCSGLAG